METNRHGFTLIELVIVVVILSIIALVALPKFLNLRADAEAATVNGLKGALADGSQLVHAKAAIEHLDEGNGTISINGGDISIRAGFPRVAGNCGNFTSQLAYWLSVDIDSSICAGGNDADWYGYAQQNSFHFMPAQYSNISERCYVTYVTASEFIAGSWVDKDSASIIAETSGCGN